MPLPEADPAPALLNWQQARTSPCNGCSAECCNVLPLRDFQINTLADVDWALYLLNFEGMELSVVDAGAGVEAWQVSMHIACRNLTAERRCAVHNTDQQPAICKRFNPYACSYRRIYQKNESRFSLRMDRARMQAWAGLLSFDDDRRVTGRPAFADLCAMMESAPAPGNSPAWDDEPADSRDRWEADTRAGLPDPEPPERTYADLNAPCRGCAAWCCTRLFIPLAAPASRQNLDYIHFLLGFPGVEIGVNNDSTWTAVIKTRCRHLQRAADGSGACGLIGHPDRPQICTYYDATGCAYKEHFGRPRPRSMVRVRYEEFDTLAGLFRFDGEGYITAAPDMQAVRGALEAGWRA